MQYTPEVVQVVPHMDYTVSVYFSDGKIVLYDVRPKLKLGVFRVLEDVDIFMGHCKILNDTLAWDVLGNRDETACIDIDPETLYALDAVDDPLAELAN